MKYKPLNSGAIFFMTTVYRPGGGGVVALDPLLHIIIPVGDHSLFTVKKLATLLHLSPLIPPACEVLRRQSFHSFCPSIYLFCSEV